MNTSGCPDYQCWHKLPKHFVLLAPMEGVTNVAFRELIAQLGKPDMFFTEFTSADGLFSKGRERVLKRLQFTERQRPIIAQIWGNNPDNYLKAASLIRELGFDGLDINMGCPVGKIIKKGYCSGLIKNPSLAQELVIAAKEGAKQMPVSVKTRCGYNKLVTEEWIGQLLESKPTAIILHGRTAKQMSKVPANWEEINKATKLCKDQGVIIVGNGDVVSLEEARYKCKIYGVDGVMIGRGIFSNLFIFNRNKTSNDFYSLSACAKLNLLLEHCRVYSRFFNTINLKPLKRFYKVYAKGFSDASELREELVTKGDTLPLVEDIVSNFLKNKQ